MLLDIQNTVKKLASYDNTSFPILSTYLEITREDDCNHLVEKFDKLVTYTLSQQQQQEIADDILYTKSFLQSYTCTHPLRGIALFSGDNQVWEVITTPFPLPTTLSVGHAPHLEPFFSELKEYQRYLIILADREKAQFFTIHLGEIEYQEQIVNNSVPQKVRAQGSAELAKRIDNHIKDHLHRHLKSVSEKVRIFVQDKPVTAVVIGGHKELINTLQEHLPKRLQKKIVGELIAEPDAPITDLVNKSKLILRRIDKTFQVQPSPYTFNR